MNSLQKAYVLDRCLQSRGTPFPASVICRALERNLELSKGFFSCIQQNCPDKDWMNQRISNRKLTLLHISVILGRTETTLGLLECGANPNLTDKWGWTPLHHAALAHHYRLIQILLVHKADPSLRTQHGADYNDILTYTTKPKANPDDEIPLMFDQNGKITALTHRLFQKLTGAVYIEETFFHPARYLRCTMGKQEKLRLPFKDEIIDRYLKDPRPKLCMKKITHDNQGSKLAKSPGYGVYATDNIAKGRFICEYHGEVLLKKVGKTGYSIEWNMDGKEYRNEGPLINDGFPNVGMLPVRGLKGQPFRQIFFSLAPIGKEDQVLWNYGAHHVKLEPRVELSYQKAKDFIFDVDLNHMTTLLTKLGRTQEVSLEEFGLVEQFRYVIGTPTLLYQLVLDGSVSKDKGKELFKLGAMCIWPESMMKGLMELFQAAADNRTLIEKTRKLGLPKTAQLYMDSMIKQTASRDFSLLIEYASWMASWMDKFLQRYKNPIIQELSPEQRDETFAISLQRQFQMNAVH